jgi:hypothetical protein
MRLLVRWCGRLVELLRGDSSGRPARGRVNLNQICGMKLHPGDVDTEFFEGRND